MQVFCYFGIALAVATMSNERAEVWLELAVLTDPLTGTGNRRWLAQRLPVELPVQSAIAQLDLERFKHINDRFGHAVGDQVLVAFANCLQEQLRGSDLLARTGGEEFVIYLPAVKCGSRRPMRPCTKPNSRAVTGWWLITLDFVSASISTANTSNSLGRVQLRFLGSTPP